MPLLMWVVWIGNTPPPPQRSLLYQITQDLGRSSTLQKPRNLYSPWNRTYSLCPSISRKKDYFVLAGWLVLLQHLGWPRGKEADRPVQLLRLDRTRVQAAESPGPPRSDSGCCRQRYWWWQSLQTSLRWIGWRRSSLWIKNHPFNNAINC